MSTKTAPAKFKALPGHKLVYELLYDLPDGKPGRMGDGKETYRTTSGENASRFAAQHTCYGQAIEVGEPRQTPMKLYIRWVREGKI